MNRPSSVLQAIVLLLTATVSALTGAKPVNELPANGLPAKIWNDAGDVSSMNLFYGAGGKDHAPDPSGRYTFIKEAPKGKNPKFDVEDGQGIRWRVKLGDESQPETAATRLLWAAGFFVDEDYYLSEIKVTGVPRKFLSDDGAVVGARLERREKKHSKKLGSWDWFNNPFVDTKELNALRVMMSLLNDWDVKSENNSIIEVDGERRFIVSDVGATFGRTGGIGRRTKGFVNDYAASTFIDNITPEYVDFVLRSRPFFPMILDFYHYRQLTAREKVSKHIPRTHAKWLGERLAGLNEDQIRDCFRAARFSQEEVQGYTNTVRKRIAELNAL
jgi:hypothetical protein